VGRGAVEAALRSASVDPEPGEEVFFHGHPSWRSILDFYIKGIALSILAGALAGAITAVATSKLKVEWVVGVVLVTLVVVLLLGLITRLQTTYTITNQRLTIDTGILSRELHQTRLERVQNVNCHQSLLERLLQVGAITFDTAGEAGYDFAFRGVSRPHDIVRTVDRAIRSIHRRVPPADETGV
jgi:uncharacterized membrane protein YdbT with pleckstrin-like domain